MDNELLRKNHLTCPDDYIPDKLPVTRAPRGNLRGRNGLALSEYAIGAEALEDAAALSSVSCQSEGTLVLQA